MLDKKIAFVENPEYDRSPAPLVFFLFMAFVSFLIGVLIFYSPWLFSFIPWFLLLPWGFLAMFLGFMFLSISPGAVAINKEWEEAIILRFGRYVRLVGPGLFFKWPFIEVFMKRDKRIITLDIPKQEVMTKDNISISIDAVVFMRVRNTKDSILNIQRLHDSVRKYAQTTMRDVVGGVELDELLTHRDQIAERIEKMIELEIQEWGTDVSAVKLQDIELPMDMKRVIARQAEAEREKRAVIIKVKEN